MYSSLDSVFGRGESEAVPAAEEMPVQEEVATESQEVSVPESDTEVAAEVAPQADDAESGEEATPTPGEQPSSSESKIPIGALHAERRKRQQLEREIAELRKGRVEQPAAPVQAQQEEKLDFYSDPQKYVDTVVGQTVSKARLDWSETVAREKYPDFQEKLESFMEAAQANPMLLQQMSASIHPAEYAYKAGQTYSETKEMGDLNEWRSREREKLRAEVEAELRKSMAVTTAKQVPASLTAVRGQGNTAAAQPKPEPTSLDSIFSRRR